MLTLFPQKKAEKLVRAFKSERLGITPWDAGLIGGLHADRKHVHLMLKPVDGDADASANLMAEIKTYLENAAPRWAIHVMLSDDKPKQPSTQAHNAPKNNDLLPSVKFSVAVASGKGGVGKSTVAANLAVAAAQKGLRVGLLDADIYGPSVPLLFDEHKKPEQNEDGKLIPFDKFGVKFMSIGFLVEREAPMIWRGPMVQSALVQLMRDVEWGELDLLFIDMPPGTGDAQLTLAQKINLAGAVIVSTPQDLALADARKGMAMFEATHVPLLGLIENMSYYHCPKCGHEDAVFGHGGAQAETVKKDIPFLGAIPLNGIIREASDAGQPIAHTNPDMKVLFGRMVDMIVMGIESAQKQRPIIRFVD